MAIDPINIPMMDFHKRADEFYSRANSDFTTDEEDLEPYTMLAYNVLKLAVADLKYDVKTWFGLTRSELVPGDPRPLGYLCAYGNRRGKGDTFVEYCSNGDPVSQDVYDFFHSDDALDVISMLCTDKYRITKEEAYDILLKRTIEKCEKKARKNYKA